MYFLVYVVPATGGTGFGVFCVIMIALAMLVGAAQYGITWLLAPVATIMALDRAIRCGNDTSESVYDQRGLLFI